MRCERVLARAGAAVVLGEAPEGAVGVGVGVGATSAPPARLEAMRPPPAPPLAAMVVVVVVLVGLGEAARATPRGGAVERTGPELEVEVAAAGAELVLLLLLLVLVRKAPSVECEALRVELVIERVARWWRRVCVSGDLGRGISGQDGGRRWWTVAVVDLIARARGSDQGGCWRWEASTLEMRWNRTKRMRHEAGWRWALTRGQHTGERGTRGGG